VNCVQKFGWEILHHPPYSPDLAPGGYDALRAVASKQIFRPWRQQGQKDTRFFQDGMNKIVYQCDKYLGVQGDYVEKVTLVWTINLEIVIHRFYICSERNKFMKVTFRSALVL
jgi:hypothetical protein